MAGGMTAGGGETLLQRVVTTRARETARRGHSTADFHGGPTAKWVDALRPPTPSGPPIKHCWYEGPHGRQAALLLEWRGIEGYYRGRIVVASLEQEGWAVVEMWVEQGLLSPVE